MHSTVQLMQHVRVHVQHTFDDMIMSEHSSRQSRGRKTKVVLKDLEQNLYTIGTIIQTCAMSALTNISRGLKLRGNMLFSEFCVFYHTYWGPNLLQHLHARGTLCVIRITSIIYFPQAGPLKMPWYCLGYKLACTYHNVRSLHLRDLYAHSFNCRPSLYRWHCSCVLAYQAFSCVSACNIERLEGAWGWVFNMHVFGWMRPCKVKCTHGRSCTSLSSHLSVLLLS